MWWVAGCSQGPQATAPEPPQPRCAQPVTAEVAELHTGDARGPIVAASPQGAAALITAEHGRTRVQRLTLPRFAEVAATPARTVEAPRVALDGPLTWLIGGAPSPGARQIQALGPEAAELFLFAPDGVPVRELGRVMAEAPGDASLWIAGWVGATGSPAELIGWAAELGIDGKLRQEHRFDLGTDGQPARETSIGAVVPADGGAFLAGHRTRPEGPAQDASFVARVGVDGWLTPLSGIDPRWT